MLSKLKSYTRTITLNCEAELLVTCDWTRRGPNQLRQGPLIILTGEQERILSRHLDRFKEVAVFQSNRHLQDLYLNNMETITDV